jgi:CRP-like cAMP-binding protein
MSRRDVDVSVLDGIAPFDRFRKRALRLLAPHVDRLRLRQGTVLVNENQTAREFIIVLEGEVIERRAGVEVGRFGPGTRIGDAAVVHHASHVSTFVAASDLELLVVNGPAYRWAAQHGTIG